MKNWRKGTALLLVGLMIMSGLVAFSAPVVVADYNLNTDVALAYDNAWQEPDTEPANDVALIYNYDFNNGNPYWLGNTNSQVELEIVNRDNTNVIYEVGVTLTSSDGALLNIVAYDNNAGAWDTTNTDDTVGTTINGDTIKTQRRSFNRSAT
jgi:hypothetical protein